ncbi:MAG: hypothetical protein H7Y42_08400 [Chitinophagaceae bacterium]|nr:hypothetical protein [Chitinophagaceae bacterium]
MEISKNWAAFDPATYLKEYYGDVGGENLALMRFLVKAFKDVSMSSIALDFGGGPTIYSLITASARVKEIHFSDYLEPNLQEVQKWLDCAPDAFDWSAFTRAALVLEDQDYSQNGILLREEEIRRRLTRVMKCDANNPLPLGKTDIQYDVLITNFCAESSTEDRSQWRLFIENITSLLKPGGKLILCALKGAVSYSVGKEVFPAVYILENDLRQALFEVGFLKDSIQIESVPADRPSRHYQGLMLAMAMKSASI